MALRVATPKKLTLKIAGAKKQKRNISAMTVRGVLGKLHVGHDRNDKVTPKLDTFVNDGDTIVFTKVTKKKVHTATRRSASHGRASGRLDDQGQDPHRA